MEGPAFALLDDGGSSGASNDEMEESSDPVEIETELELGLGLSLGNGKIKHNAWGERGRILMAKDFPSVISQDGSSSSSSSRFSGRATAEGGGVSGIKRAADSVSMEGGSPTAVRTGSSQVVGWPPIKAYRINSLVNQAKNQRAAEEKDQLSLDVSKTINDSKKASATDTVKGPLGYVKVYMDGVLIGRKVDLNAHSCYETLALMLDDMFFKFTGNVPATGFSGDHNEHKPKLSQLLNGSSEFVLTYEDKEGDWMLVGDVPWGMFLSSVKKLRIMKTSEAKGLAPRCQKGERSGIKPI